MTRLSAAPRRANIHLSGAAAAARERGLGPGHRPEELRSLL